MNSITRIGKNITKKEKRKEREKISYNIDTMKHMSKAWELKFTQKKKARLPYMDAPPICPHIECRIAEHNLDIAERRLVNKRREWLLRRQQLQLQWKELGTRENMLRDNFIIFSKFLKTNLEKRERALKKYQTDTESVQKREEEINVVRKKVERRRYEFNLMRNEIQKHSIYQTFLDKVIDISNGEFKDIEDIPDRMELLLLAKERLHAHQADQLSRLECSKRVMSQFMETNMLQIIGLNNTIAALQTAHDDAVSRTMELDRIVIDLKTTLIKSAKDLSSNQESIRNLYYQTCKMHGIQEKNRVKDIIDQLMAVNHSMKGYATIFGLMRRKSRRESKFIKQSTSSLVKF